MRNSINHQGGIGLIEVLVTIVITTIGLLGLSAMQMQSIRSVSDTGNRTHAIWVANDLINRIRANNIAVNNYTTAGINCVNGDGASNAPAVKMCASYSLDGKQEAAAGDCSNTEMATFDLWDALCGTAALTGSSAMTSSASFISRPGLVVNDLGDGDLELVISWNSRTAGQNAAGDDVYYLEAGTLAETAREDYSVVFRP